MEALGLLLLVALAVGAEGKVTFVEQVGTVSTLAPSHRCPPRRM